jgi:hypothetical protein
MSRQHKRQKTICLGLKPSISSLGDEKVSPEQGRYKNTIGTKLEEVGKTIFRENHVQYRGSLCHHRPTSLLQDLIPGVGTEACMSVTFTWPRNNEDKNV